MGSSPIARSNFCPLISLLFFFFSALFIVPAVLNAQVSTDRSRPFEQGRTIFLPGTVVYQGDLPYEIETQSDTRYHAIGGLLATRVGWFDRFSSSQMGLRSAAPGIFFEGIAYPLSSLSLLEWLPPVATVQVLDFPATAWWGLSASAGAVQIFSEEEPMKGASLWGGGGGYGGDLFYQKSELRLYLNAHQSLYNAGQRSVLSKIRWLTMGDLEMQSGILAANTFSNDGWTCFFTKVHFHSPNFQTFEVKPYIQSARSGSLNAQEIGCDLDYHFNLAGLAESHWSAGCGRMDAQSGHIEDKGFVQTNNLLDVLGSFTADMAFRLDFSNLSDVFFSSLVGFQYVQDEMVFFGDFSKGVLQGGAESALQAELGARYQPADPWFLGLRGIYQEVGDQPFIGLRCSIGLNAGRGLLFKEMTAQIDGLSLQGTNGSTLLDAGGLVQFKIYEGNRLWVRGRVLSNSPFLVEAGLEQSLNRAVRVFVSMANLQNLSIAWPDALGASGTVVKAGLEGRY